MHTRDQEKPPGACYLIGGRGRLGQALAHEYGQGAVMTLDRRIYSDWTQAGAVDKISRYFEKHANQSATVLVACGLLDPKLPADELLSVNYQLPKNLIDAVSKLGINVVTFGTVMEGLLQSKNPYIQTKTILGEYVRAVASSSSPAAHVQMHTLYGIGQPSGFMFLGQLLASLKQNAPFRMTSGQQLREYHHVADDARAIRQIATVGALGVLDVSHGKPLSLKALAEGVFEALGKRQLLQLGALPEPREENYEKTLVPVKMLQSIAFRDSLPAIVQYIRQCHATELTPDIGKMQTQ